MNAGERITDAIFMEHKELEMPHDRDPLQVAWGCHLMIAQGEELEFGL